MTFAMKNHATILNAIINLKMLEDTTKNGPGE